MCTPYAGSGRGCLVGRREKKYADFKERLEAFKPTLDALGIGYAVTSVAEPGTFQRQKPRRLFYCGDTHYELKLNEERKAKGEK